MSPWKKRPGRRENSSAGASLSGPELGIQAAVSPSGPVCRWLGGSWQMGLGSLGGGKLLLLLLLHHSQEVELIRTPRSGHEGAMDTIPALWQPAAR